MQAVLAEGRASGVLPEGLPASHLQALQERLPPLHEVTSREDTRAAAGDGDFVVSKAVVPQEQEISIIKFLPLRNPRGNNAMPSGQVGLPSTLLVAAQLDGGLRLFSPSGELLSSFGAGHDLPISVMAVSPLHDEYLIATCDVGGIVRIHKIGVRQRRVTKENRQARKSVMVDKVSQFFGSQANVTVQYNRRFRMPNISEAGEPNRTGTPSARVSALVMASLQGTKYFVAGHVDGNVTVFTRNGTLHARFNTGIHHAVDSLNVHLNSVVFTSQGQWGFVDLEKMEARAVHCPRFEGRVASAAIDAQHQSRVVISDDAGDIWVLNMQNKRQCSVEHRFPKGTAEPAVDVASIRGFTLALHHDPLATGGRRSVLTALNMSHAGKKRDDSVRSVPPVVWRRFGQSVRDWAVHKRYQQGDLLATLSEDGMEIELLEVLMQVYIDPQVESFSNFKLPVFAVAIVLVLGYQYVKGKGAFDPSIMEGVAGGAGGLGGM